MDLYSIIVILICLSAIFGYLNVRFLKLPVTIGLMIISILFSVGILIIGQFESSILEFEADLIGRIDFYELLMEGMLSFLLFAGALHVDFDELKRHRLPIVFFATLGVLVSTFLVGTGMFYVLAALDLHIQYIHCLLFGALISPTDPIAVLGILKKLGVPKQLETKITGESLFNDGIGVVIFLTLYNIAQAGAGDIQMSEVGLLFLEEVGGGVLLGLLIGYVSYSMMKTIDDYEVEVMITLAAVMGGYLLASELHFSGPLAMVVAGLMVGHERFRISSMSEEVEVYVDKFWELVDVLLNAVLFVLIGMEIVVITLNVSYLVAGLLAIPVVLLSRYLALLPPIRLFERRLDFVPNTHAIMTWGGLRGGISIALALSLSAQMPRDIIITMTYVVVVFSIVVQGLTVGSLVNFFQTRARPAGGVTSSTSGQKNQP